MYKVFLGFVSNVVLLFILAGCSSQPRLSVDSAAYKQSIAIEEIPAYRVGVDDTLQINVWRNPDLSVTVPVRPDGMISMPLIGDVKAAGLKPETISYNIEKQLKNYVRDPNVTIMVTGLQSHEYLSRIRVTGAVNNPISLNYRQGMTVLDAVLAAGSTNDFAAPNKTHLYRKINGKTRVIEIYLGDILFQGKLKTNINLKPGDIITVPEKLF